MVELIQSFLQLRCIKQSLITTFPVPMLIITHSLTPLLWICPNPRPKRTYPAANGASILKSNCTKDTLGAFENGEQGPKHLPGTVRDMRKVKKAGLSNARTRVSINPYWNSDAVTWASGENRPRAAVAAAGRWKPTHWWGRPKRCGQPKLRCWGRGIVKEKVAAVAAGLSFPRCL